MFFSNASAHKSEGALEGQEALPTYTPDERAGAEEIRNEAIHPITESSSKGRSGKGEPSASKGGEVMAPEDQDELEETDYDPGDPATVGIWSVMMPEKLPSVFETAEAPETKPRQEMIAALRSLADYIDARPGVPFPNWYCINAFVETKEEMRDAALAMGTCDKPFNERWITLSKRFGPIQFDINIEREKVCTAKVVGTRVVPERVEQILEWECTDSILGGAK